MARFTGERLHGAKYRAIVVALSEGQSKNKLAKRLKVSPSTILAVQDAEKKTIEERKKALVDVSLRISQIAAEQLEDHVTAGSLTPQQLVPIYGVSADKVAALTADPAISQLHLHAHVHKVDLQAEWRAMLGTTSVPGSAILDVEATVVSGNPKEQYESANASFSKDDLKNTLTPETTR